MWCRSCRQDVPGLVDGLDGRFACPRCSAVLLSDAGLDLTENLDAARPTIADPHAPSAYASHSHATHEPTSHEADPYEPPVFEPVRPTVTEASRVTTLRWDAANWELNEKLRHVERVTASSRLRFDAPSAAQMPPPHGPWNPPSAASYPMPYPQTPAMGAHPYARPVATSAYAAPPQPAGPFAPSQHPESPAPQAPNHYEWNGAPPPRPEDHWDTPLEIIASLTTWLFLGLSVMAFSCGGFLAAWGGIAGRPHLQNMGMPIVIVGIGLLVIGLLPRIFLNRVEEEDRRQLALYEREREERLRETPAPHARRAPQYAGRDR